MVEYDEHALIGKNLVDITTQEDRADLRDRLTQLQRGEIVQVRHHKKYIKNGGGTIRCFSLIMAVDTVREDRTRYLLDWCYEVFDNDSDNDRIRHLEDLLAEVLKVVSKTHGTNIVISNDDRRGDTVSADRGSTVNQNSHNELTHTVVACLAVLALAVVISIALVVKGSLSVEHKDSKINVNPSSQEQDLNQ